jgi:hypothetical protein
MIDALFFTRCLYSSHFVTAFVTGAFVVTSIIGTGTKTTSVLVLQRVKQLRIVMGGTTGGALVGMMGLGLVLGVTIFCIAGQQTISSEHLVKALGHFFDSMHRPTSPFGVLQKLDLSEWILVGYSEIRASSLNQVVGSMAGGVLERPSESFASVGREEINGNKYVEN